MLNLRVRTVTDNGSVTAASRILDTTNILYTATLNASATLEFSVSRKDFAPTQFPFLVRVEYRAGTDEFDVLPTEDLFIIESDGDDSKDAAQIVTYEGKSFVPWLLGGAYVGTGSWEKDNERRIDNGAANAGRIMSFFIDESKGRGWLTPLTKTFNGTTDSNGVAWTTDDRVDIAWRLETFYPQVLEQLSEQALCDWDSKGNAIRLYRHNTLGTDVSESVVFGGPDFERVPVTTDVTGWYTHVIAVSDAGRVHVQNEAAETRFGRRSMALSQTGVKDKPTSTKLANEALAEGLKVKREESYEWTPHSGQVMPWKDFVVGDLVTALSRGGSLPKRVVGIVVTQAEDSATVSAVVGDKVSTLQARAQKRLNSVSVGGVIGGSGGAYPTAPPPNDFEPGKPVALSVTSNVGYWAEDWTTARSEVGLGWDAVTADTEGNPITITGYEIWSRLPSDTLALDTATHTNAVTVNSWEPGVERRVAVRAVGLNGKYSEFSTEVSITPDAPLSVVPEQVTGLTELSNVASFTPSGPVAAITLGWDAVTETTDGDPIEVARYDVLNGAVVVTSSATTTATVSMPSTDTANYTVRAVSALGYAGDPSDPVLVTANTPVVVTRVPTAPILTTG